jgi:glycosyltransferase involved in cell wall biosynthesis
MRVYVPLFWSNEGSLVFSLDRGNPGIGGTFFTTVQFGILLAQHRPDWDVAFVHRQPVRSEQSPANLRTVVHADFQEFLDRGEGRRRDVVISGAWLSRSIAPGTIARHPARHIFWSRHPFDQYVREITVKREPADIVCVGEYQWHTNRISGLPVHYIQEIYLGPGRAAAARDDRPPGSPVRAVHLSSLTPPKGFLHIARAWPTLKTVLPGIRLDVIGGTSLYGEKQESLLIPTSTAFADEILRFIPKTDIDEGRVIFHGTLGDEKNEIIRQCDFAILNPTGHSEAFPASPLEMMSLGVPVIASDDFGMADAMRFFPELTVSGHSQIPDRAHWLVSNADRYRCFRERSLRIAGDFSVKTPTLLSKWVDLIESLSTGRPAMHSLQPDLPLHGSAARLIIRRDVWPLLGKCKRAVLG